MPVDDNGNEVLRKAAIDNGDNSYSLATEVKNRAESYDEAGDLIVSDKTVINLLEGIHCELIKIRKHQELITQEKF